jgi:WD40 repeat protein
VGAAPSLHRSGSHDDTAKLWDGETGTLLHSLDGHSEIIFHLLTYKEPAALRDRIITRFRDTTITVWDAQDGTRLHTFDGQYYRPYMVLYESAEGLHRLASCSATKTLQVRDLETGRLLHDVNGAPGISKGDNALEAEHFLNMDGRYTWIWGMETGLVTVWDLGEAPASTGPIRAANKRG